MAARNSCWCCLICRRTRRCRALERLRAIIADLDWSAFSPGMKVAISAGVTTLKPRENSDTLLARADGALLHSQSEGTQPHRQRLILSFFQVRRRKNPSPPLQDRVMSSKPATAPESLLDELQTTLAHGTVARRVETLRRVTDLFINGSVNYSDEQIVLFDDVFQCLLEHIENSAKALLANRLAPVDTAPPQTIRTLGIRRPDRGRGARADAVAAARRRHPDRDGAQQEPGPPARDLQPQDAERRRHRRAGAARQRRGDPEHASTIPARNSPSAASPAWSAAPRATTTCRPASACARTSARHLYLKLVAKASDAVRQRLEAANPQQAKEIPMAVKEATRQGTLARPPP